MTARIESWFKSSRSAGNGACVEVAMTTTHIGVRDSKDRTGPTLEVDLCAWSDFIQAVRAGNFHL
jgi:hypothetical protein